MGDVPPGRDQAAKFPKCRLSWGFVGPRSLHLSARQIVVYAAAAAGVVMPRSWKRVCMPMRGSRSHGRSRSSGQRAVSTRRGAGPYRRASQIRRTVAAAAGPGRTGRAGAGGIGRERQHWPAWEPRRGTGVSGREPVPGPDSCGCRCGATKLGPRHYRWTRAPAPAASASTSARLAIDVSPGVVMASAPWAVPYSTAVCRSPDVRRP
jgi:hypothetical protein